MFYSHDLLGRKSPLGAIWTMAHGKKLSKVKILGINVYSICEHIMQPDVPQSLRLQGILVGGVAVVFSRQQLYLLEDLQEMLRRVTASKTPEQTAAAVVNTVLQRGRDKARVEAITLQDAGPEAMTLPAIMLGDLQDLEDLELLDQQDRLGAAGPDPHGNQPNDDDDAEVEGEDGGGGRSRGRRGRGGASGDAGGGRGGGGLLAEDLLMLPTLAPMSAADGGSEGAQRARGSHGLERGTRAVAQETHTQMGFPEDEMFEAPDLQLLVDDEDGDALLQAFGGYGAAATAPPKSAAPSHTTRATPNWTPAGTTAGGVPATGAAAAAAAGALEPLTTLPEPEDSEFGLEFGPDLVPLNDLTQTQEEQQQQGQQQGQLPLEERFDAASEGRPATSLLPLPSVGEPPEHYMPPSPVHDGEEVLLPVPSAATTSTGTSAGRAGAAHKRRRTSDEENDSVSEVVASLLAVTDQTQQQAAAAGDGEDAGNNNNNNNNNDVPDGQQPRAGQQLELSHGRQAARPPQARRRRPGARVTQDDVEAIVVAGRTYREWTLDSSELIRPKQKALAPKGPNGGSPDRPTAVLAGDRAGLLSGRYSGELYDGTPAARMTAAVAAALTAGDAEAASAAVLRGPAAMLRGRGMAWAPQLSRLVAMAAEADDVVVDEDEDAAPGGGAKAPARRAGAGQPDAPRGKRQRIAFAPADGEQQQQQRHDIEPSEVCNGAQQQQQRQQARRRGTDDDDLASQRSGSRLDVHDVQLAGPEQELQPLEVSEELAASEGRPASALFQAPPGAQMAEAYDAADPMDLMQDDQILGDDVEIERMRREDTPEGSEAARQREAQRLAALGLVAGPASNGRLATCDPSSRATSGSSHSSLGREDEVQTLANANATTFRRASTGAPRRFGNGTLEDLLPAINEGDVQGAVMEYMDWDDEQDLAAAAEPVTGEPEAGLSGGRSRGMSRGALRSGQRRSAGGSSGAGTATATATRTQDAPFSLKETNGLNTQAVPPQAFLGHNTKVTVAIFRKHLAGGRREVAGEGEDAVDGGAESSLSFFGLVNRLRRAEAVKLFYQTLVTSTAGYVRVAQEQPYGDITIRAGIKL